MTVRADRARERAAVRLGVAAAIAAAIAFAVVARDAASRQVHPVEGLVAPEWSAAFPGARSIHIRSPQGELTLTRASLEAPWTLAERAGYPINPTAVATLDRDLAALKFSGVRTNDPGNYDRLGVSDPASGGKGVRLTVADAKGAPIADWIVGAKRSGGVFIRRPSEARAYATQGEVPDIGAPDFWLDLDFLRLSRADIAKVEITPSGEGPAYALERGASTASDFALTDPGKGWDLITAGAGNGPGGATADLKFLDVRPRSALSGEPAGRHTARTLDGLAVTLTVYHDGHGGDWAAIDAAADGDAAPNVASRAEALTRRTSGWAYELPPSAADRLIRPLTGIAKPRG
jgi:hypothetical protein